jgi:hypothetical protein
VHSALDGLVARCVGILTLALLTRRQCGVLAIVRDQVWTVGDVMYFALDHARVVV